jgi:ferredoxin
MGITLEASSIKTVLDQLEAKGHSIEYQCREGYCGSCRTEKTNGEVEYIEEPIAALNSNEILPCCCRAKTNISVSIN